MRLLLTGFEPFGGEVLNPSEEVVAALAAAPLPGVDLTTLVLPVRGGVALEVLWPAFASGGFDAWLGLGEAGGRARLSVERLGINLLVDHDGSGNVLPERPVVEGGPAAYFSRLPVRELAERITAAGAPAEVSNTAGTYICNEVTYATQHQLAVANLDLPSGFIHLPYLPQQVLNKPSSTRSIALEVQVRGVRAAVEFVRELVASRATVATTAQR